MNSPVGAILAEKANYSGLQSAARKIRACFFHLRICSIFCCMPLSFTWSSMVEKQGIRRCQRGFVLGCCLNSAKVETDSTKKLKWLFFFTRSLVSGCWQKTQLTFFHDYPSASNLTHEILESQLGSRFMKSRDTFHLKFICFWVWKASLKNFDIYILHLIWKRVFARFGKRCPGLATGE